MLPLSADDLRQLPRCPPPGTGSRGVLGSVSHVSYRAELWSLPAARASAAGPVCGLSHACADVQHDHCHLSWPAGARAGAHTLDQGLSAPQRRPTMNACRESPLFATSTAFPAGVWISASPVTSRGARKPLATGGTGVKWPRPSPLSHRPLPASAGVVFGSVSYRLPATIRSRLPSPSTSSARMPRIGAICARLGSGTTVNVPSPLFCR